MPNRRARFPLTFWLGLALIALCQGLVFADYFWRGRVVVPEAPLHEPVGLAQHVARSIAVHMAPLVWCGYLLLAEGLLDRLARRQGEPGSCVRQRPWLFITAYLTSVPVWCYWDWINFYLMDAWRYHGLAEYRLERYAGYFLAFAAISPAMFLAAQLYQRLGLARWRTATGRRAAIVTMLACIAIAAGLAMTVRVIWEARYPFGLDITTSALLLFAPGLLMLLAIRNTFATVAAFGAGWLVYSWLIRNPAGNFVMWAAPWFLLDPINHALGRPSLFADWRAGRYGRTVALALGGLTCGLLWEFWNYFAVAKWVYVLPFLGPLEHAKYFEMPIVGLVGFLPFGPACWVMLQSLLLLMPGVTEPLPSEQDVL
jgi:hypothetical protein